MATSKSAYREMIRLQKLAKAHHEMELSRLAAEVAAIEEENAALFQMNGDRRDGNASFIPAGIITKRLETNKTKLARITETMMAEKRELLKASRTLDTLDQRLRLLERELDRVQAAVEIDEYISHSLAKHSV